MKRSDRHVLSALGLMLVVGCSLCSGPAEAPTKIDIERLMDPYAKAPPMSPVADTKLDGARAGAVLDAVGQELGYGHATLETLQNHATDGWWTTFVRLVADGRSKQVEAAWEILSETLLAGQNIPPDIKLTVRKAQATMYDYTNAKADPDTMRRAALCELAWTFYVIRNLPVPSHHAP